MTDRDGIPRSSDPNPQGADPRRDRAHAVHSLDDETRLQAGGDETDLVQGAGGDLRRPEAEDVDDVAGATDHDNSHDHEG